MPVNRLKWYGKAVLGLTLLVLSTMGMAKEADAGGSASGEAKPAANFTALEKLNIAGAGLVLVHPTLGVGYYDAVRFRDVTIRYREGQRPMPKKREDSLREKILADLRQSALDSGTQIAELSGACVVDIKVAVLNVDLEGVGRKGGHKRSLGSATLAYDMRDSTTGERLVTLAGKRDFGAGLDRSGGRDDFKRLTESVSGLMVEMGQTLGKIVSDEIRAREEGTSGKEGCTGALRKAAEAALESAQAAE